MCTNEGAINSPGPDKEKWRRLILEDTLLLSFQGWIGVPLVENHVHYINPVHRFGYKRDVPGNSSIFVSPNQQELDHGLGPDPALGRLRA